MDIRQSTGHDAMNSNQKQSAVEIWTAHSKAFDALRVLYRHAATGNLEALKLLGGVMGYARSNVHQIAAFKKNKAACEIFLDEIEAAISSLEIQQIVIPELLTSLAESRCRWPSWIYLEKYLQDNTENMARRLGLGRKYGINFTGKQASRKNVEVNVAWNCYVVLRQLQGSPRPKKDGVQMSDEWTKAQALAKPLKPLSRTNYRQWWKAAQPLFVAEYGEEFEKHKLFAHFQFAAERRAIKEERKIRSVMRTMIKNRICQAFKSIAPHDGGVQ